METEYEPNVTGSNGVESHDQSNVNKVSSCRTVRFCCFLLRFLAIVTTLVPATIVGVAKETESVPITVVPNLPPLYIAATVKSKYVSAIVFFIASNAIACAYAALSLIVSIANRTGSGTKMTFVLVDLMMVALLFSGNGAAIAIGVIANKGNSHIQWNEVCNVFGSYCNKLATSIIVSLIGSLIFILLIIFAMFSLKRSKSM